jgi:hypothetical protein
VRVCVRGMALYASSISKIEGLTMDVRGLQAALNARGHKPALLVDGKPGKNTMRAVEALVGNKPSWSDERLRVAAEQIIYRDVGIEVGDIDGLVGEQTRYAREVWKARQSGNEKKIAKVETWRDTAKPPPAGHNTPPEVATKTRSDYWPRQDEASMNRFFGARGTNQVDLVLPFPMRIAWAPAQVVSKFSCNRKVHDPLFRIFKRTLDHYGIDEIRRLRLDMYGGCLNVRKMRGGSAWSIHSWGCAVDIDPERNQLKFKRSAATLDDPPYKAFWGFVYDEGAISLGIERDYDWMHFQFARL